MIFQGREKSGELLRRDRLAHFYPLLNKKRLQLTQITPIGFQRVGRQPAFDSKVPEVPFNQRIENLIGQCSHKA